MRSAIVTGGTGLLGSWLLKRLSKDYDQIFAIARSSNGTPAKNRIRSILSVHEKDPSSVDSIMLRVTVLDGDIHEQNLGLSSQQVENLLKSHVTDIFHSAALAEFRVPYEKIYVTNVLGTENALNLAVQLKRVARSNTITFHHISSVVIAGDYEGCFSELDFDRGQRFNNTYERTKFEAERVVMSYSQELHTVIYRPSIITGDSIRGVTTNFKMLYQPVRFVTQELFSALPAHPGSMHSLVPVDRVAEAIRLLSKQEHRSGQVYQLVNPHQITFQQFIDSICAFFCCKPPTLEPANTFRRDLLSAVQWKIVEPFVPYFNHRGTVGAECTNSLLTKLGFCWPRIDSALINTLYTYCQKCGFVRKPVVS
jgi:thioester reductase-like protein